jgi:hypothetical protein
MSLLARSVATLEGIALTADPNYQMVAQVRGISRFSLLLGSSCAMHALVATLEGITLTADPNYQMWRRRVAVKFSHDL